ncbi:putative transposase-like protein [Cardamine amara subsp. amara]|uniref:Transposase-like protein n=1 Tax=Cardamine amara subsp. amara TaxID=228776 RepID=A0ABD1C1Y8_CARAN
MAARGRKRAARGERGGGRGEGGRGGRGRGEGGGGGGSVESQRRTTDSGEGTQAAATASSRDKRPSSLPSQYDFVPREKTQPPPPLVTNNNRPVCVRDYPPPRSLFQISMTQPEETPSPQARPSGHSSQAQNSPTSQPHSSQAHSSQPQQPQQEAPFEEDNPSEPSLSEDQTVVMNSLLTQQGRELYTTVLSPIEKPETTWFGRDKSSLTRKITKIFTNKFDGPFYSWTCVPRDRQERYFVEFAKTHTWDPIITGVVQKNFEKICQIRMKDMVSNVRTSREQPKWITGSLWKQMVEHWNTEEAMEKSETTSHSRMSNRGGLGPHKHLSGPKSYLQIEQEMEVELGRPVSVGEVFIKTHTKPDGTFVDLKAEKVAEAYKKNKEAKLAELEVDIEDDLHGTSRRRDLSVEEDNEIFLKSTFVNDRGQAYGVGSLESVINGKRKYPGSSSSFLGMQQQLEEAHRKIEEQAASNTVARRAFSGSSCTTEQDHQLDVD